ncbi:MAG: enoyl-CoA hydratase-related protein [Solirubrobacterales bacterium]
MSEESMVIRSERDGFVVLELNRPEALNALSIDLREELIAAVEAADADPAVRAIVICGSEEVFAAGADIKMLLEADLAGAIELGRAKSVFQTVADCRTPVIAGVSGFALGGGFELVLACDIVIASDTAVFGFPEVTLGILPGGGGTQRLARVAGKQKAMELVLTGRRIDVNEAKRLGFIADVVKLRDWRENFEALAATIARRPPLAVKLAKQAVLAADELGLSGGLDYERRLFEIAMASEDRVEGMTAFVEKRKPEFKGK